MKHQLFDTLSSEELTILRTVLEYGVASKDEIICVTGYKNTTANRLLDNLREQGLVVVCGEGDSTGGRRPLLYALNKEKRIYCIGIMIGLYHIDVSLIHYSGEVLSLETAANEADCTPDQALMIVKNLYDKILAAQELQPEDIYYAGLSAFCSISKSSGEVALVSSSVFGTKSWFGFPLCQRVSELLGVDVVAETSANAACLGEFLLGQGKKRDNVCFLLCGGGGIRIGCIQNGTLVRPVHNQDNAFGHMIIAAGGEKCECGNYGCIYAYASVPAIRERFITLMKIGRTSRLGVKALEEITILDILQSADEGDPLSVEVITNAAAMLAIGIINYINLTSPEVFICGGILIENCHLFYDVIKEKVGDKMPILEKDIIGFSLRSQYGKPVIGDGLLAVEAVMGRRY